jgi:hypothetical protein
MSALKVTNLLRNETVDETAGAASPLGQSSHFNVTVEWGNGATGGVVEIEAAPHKDYAGTWTSLATFAWAAANKIDMWRGTGPFGALRARISTVVTTTDKGITVDLWEN